MDITNDTILKDGTPFTIGYAVNDPRGLAPKDWFIPTSSDFSALNNYIACLDVYSHSGTHLQKWVQLDRVRCLFILHVTPVTEAKLKED